jgi:hypothetical protein
MTSKKKAEEKAPAIKEENLPANPQEFFDLKENMEGVVPKLQLISIKHSAQMFELPDGSKVESFVGIILDHNAANAWWEKSYEETGGGVIPDCFSMDGLFPSETAEKKQHTNCRSCPMNQFGSDPDGGKGKACKNMKRLHILFEKELMPHRLSAPPSSIKAIDAYLSRLASQGLPHQLVKTTFSLKVTKNATGIEFSTLAFEPGDVVTDPEAAKQLRNLYRQWKPICRMEDITSDEY